MEHENLLARPDVTPPARLPASPEAEAAGQAAREAGTDPAEVAARFPAYPAAWATLAERALAQGTAVEAYAYARTGYHRGLDQLRGAGWRGHGPVPWEHEPNRGFLRSLHLLGRAAAAIGEDAEAERCATFLAEASPAAAEALNAR
jgi:Protein of unknown function (DUF3151)